MSRFQLVLVHFNHKSSNYINGATKRSKSREYSKHSWNPVYIEKKSSNWSLFMDGCIHSVSKENIHTKNSLLQRNVDAKMQLPASSGYFASRIYWFAFELVSFSYVKCYRFFLEVFQPIYKYDRLFRALKGRNLSPSFKQSYSGEKEVFKNLIFVCDHFCKKNQTKLLATHVNSAAAKI